VTREWANHALGEICDVRKGTVITEKAATPGDVPVIAGGIGPTYFHSTANRGPGVTTVSASGANAGYVSHWEIPIFASDCTTVEPVDDAALDRRFLFRQLSWLEPRIRASLRKGAAQPHVYAKDLAQLEIQVPPIEDQRRIIGILDVADDLRTKRRESLNLVGSIANSIFLDFFGNPLTNDRGWPIRRLGDLGVLDRGVSKHRPRNDPALLGGPYPLVQTGDVANSGGYITTFRTTYSELGLDQSRLWPAGTLCITIAANIARTGILGFDACFPDSVVGFTTDVRGMTEYVRVLLGFHQARLERLAPEFAQKNINLKILRELPVVSPPVELLARFDVALEARRLGAVAGDESCSRLDELFASLENRAFRGQL